MNEELKVMFPNYHLEDYVLSVAQCCGSCKKGRNKTYFVECQLPHSIKSTYPIEMFPYGYCPQYERNPDIKMPVIVHPVNNEYGNGQG